MRVVRILTSKTSFIPKCWIVPLNKVFQASVMKACAAQWPYWSWNGRSQFFGIDYSNELSLPKCNSHTSSCANCSRFRWIIDSRLLLDWQKVVSTNRCSTVSLLEVLESDIVINQILVSMNWRVCFTHDHSYCEKYACIYLYYSCCSLFGTAQGKDSIFDSSPVLISVDP